MATWDLTETKHHLLICNGSSCNKSGAEELTQAVRNEIAERGLDHQIHTTRTKCNGRCQDKCVLVVYPKGVWYKDMKAEDAPQLLDALQANVNLDQKVAFTYEDASFTRTESTIVGEEKNKDRVKKVSKVL